MLVLLCGEYYEQATNIQPQGTGRGPEACGAEGSAECARGARHTTLSHSLRGAGGPADRSAPSHALPELPVGVAKDGLGVGVDDGGGDLCGVMGEVAQCALGGAPVGAVDGGVMVAAAADEAG